MKFTIKRITYKKHLKGYALCSQGIIYFKRKFPKGMPVNRENIMGLKYIYFQYWLYRYNKPFWRKWMGYLPNLCSDEDALRIFCDKFLPKKKKMKNSMQHNNKTMR
jgi:hypothetical protein